MYSGYSSEGEVEEAVEMGRGCGRFCLRPNPDLEARHGMLCHILLKLVIVKYYFIDICLL